MRVVELERYRQDFEEIANQARVLTDGLTEAQFNWRPGPNEWSVEECLAHLTIIGHHELRAVERAIDAAKRDGVTGTGPFPYNSIDRFIVAMIEPPARTKFTSPRRFTPLHGQPLTAVLPTFLHLQSHLMIQVERADGLDLARVRVAMPVSRFLKMSLGMTFARVAAHERRHLQQARLVWENLPVLPPVHDSRPAALQR